MTNKAPGNLPTLRAMRFALKRRRALDGLFTYQKDDFGTKTAALRFYARARRRFRLKGDVTPIMEYSRLLRGS